MLTGHDISPTDDGTRRRRTIATWIALPGLALCVLSMFDVGVPLDIDGIPIGALAVAVAIPISWRGPLVPGLGRTIGFLMFYAGLFLLAAAPFAGRAELQLPWHGVPHALALVVAGVVLRIRSLTPEERLRIEARKTTLRADTTRSARATVVMVTPTSQTRGVEPIADVELRLADGRALTVRLPVPLVYLSRLVPRAELPVLVRDDDPDDVRIDWERWNDEVRRASSADGP